MNAPGLRERKKQKTRWAIQEQALRLFAEQGYDATTIEQIAAAAEISPSTFFRYFKTKEDVVVEDEYDPIMAAALTAAPADLAPLPAIRHALRSALDAIGPAEREKIIERGRLMLSVPALRSRSLDNLVTTIDVIAGPLAARTGRDPQDFAVRAFAGACIGALIAAVLEWVDGNGERDLSELVDAALGALENGLDS
jgi:AcrR family transcriptional regulator